MRPLSLKTLFSLHSLFFPISPLHHFIPPTLSKHATLLSASTCTLSSFSRLHPPTPNFPLAGCKMDSPQSKSSGEEQKAEENKAQGELQRGRRHSVVLSALCTLTQLYLLTTLRSLLFAFWKPLCSYI